MLYQCVHRGWIAGEKGPFLKAKQAQISRQSVAGISRVPTTEAVQENTAKACIRALAPYLSYLLKLDNLPPTCKDVSDLLLHGESTVEDRIHTSARRAGSGVVK